MNRVERTLRQLLGVAEIYPRKSQFIQTYHDFSAQQFHADLLNHLGKGLVMKLDFFQLESCRTQVIRVGINRLSIGNTGDPRQKAI